MPRSVPEIRAFVADRAAYINEHEDEDGDFDIVRLDSLDIAAIRADLIREWSWEIWDKKSPINGVPAEQLLAARHDIPEGGAVYLIKQGDRVVYFQPHTPREGGHRPIPPGAVAQYAVKHLDEVIDNEIVATILQLISR